MRIAEAHLNALQSVPEYAADLSWRIARVYQRTDRPWEALWAFYHLYQDYPEHPQCEDFCYISFNQARATREQSLIEQIGTEYLGQEGFRAYRIQVTLGLADAYLQAGDEAAFVGLAERYLHHPENPRTAAHLIHRWALVFTAEARFRALCQRMRALIRQLEALEPPPEPALETARYWHAFAHLRLHDYAAAAADLQEFLADYADMASRLLEDAHFRYGIALFGEGRAAAAETQLLGFIQDYPASHLRGEAELYLGDLKRAGGATEAALVHYEQVALHTEQQDLISQAVFAISELQLAAGRSEAAFQTVQSYLDRYGDAACSAQALYRLGKIRESQGQLAERFRIHRQAIQQLGNDPQRSAVDRLIREYVRDYPQLQACSAASIQFLKRLLDEPDFRRRFLGDRVFQYAFLQGAEGAQLDAALRHGLVRDRQMRAGLIESATVSSEQVEERLYDLLQRFEIQAGALAEYDAAAFFTELYSASSADSAQQILELRSRMALDFLGLLPGGLAAVSEAQLLQAPASVRLWQADTARAAADPQRARALYQSVVETEPFSSSAATALEALGQLAVEDAQACTTVSGWERALHYYDRLVERTSRSSPSAAPLLSRARILLELQRWPEAIEVLDSILRNPAWRGLDHARAQLALGKLHLEQQQWLEAHAFFERLIVAYGSYLKRYLELYATCRHSRRWTRQTVRNCWPSTRPAWMSSREPQHTRISGRHMTFDCTRLTPWVPVLLSVVVRLQMNADPVLPQLAGLEPPAHTFRLDRPLHVRVHVNENRRCC